MYDNPQTEKTTTNNPQVPGSESVLNNPQERETSLPTGEELASPLERDNVSDNPPSERTKTEKIEAPGVENNLPNPQGRQTDLLTEEERDSLLERAKKGDTTVLPLLGRVLDECPALWQSYGDLALHAQRALVQLAGGGGENLYLCESLMRKLAAMKAELMGDSPSAPEKLLADHVAACWLQANYYDALVAQSRQSPPAKLKLLQQQQDAAHRRYLAAFKTLATVRKLLTPARSPIEIAAKLAGERSGLRLRRAPGAEGVPVDN